MGEQKRSSHNCYLNVNIQYYKARKCPFIMHFILLVLLYTWIFFGYDAVFHRSHAELTN